MKTSEMLQQSGTVTLIMNSACTSMGKESAGKIRL
jgi:hypothetical protein